MTSTEKDNGVEKIEALPFDITSITEQWKDPWIVFNFFRTSDHKYFIMTYESEVRMCTYWGGIIIFDKVGEMIFDPKQLGTYVPHRNFFYNSKSQSLIYKFVYLVRKDDDSTHNYDYTMFIDIEKQRFAIINKPYARFFDHFTDKSIYFKEKTDLFGNECTNNIAGSILISDLENKYFEFSDIETVNERINKMIDE